MNSNSRIALITGASRGLGKALARQLANEGWTLLLTARGEAALSETATEIGAHYLAGDVADPHHRDRLTKKAHELGGLDLLVNNASSLGPTPLPKLADVYVDELAPLFTTNVFAPLALTQAILPLVRARQGAIITISSDAATEPYEQWGAYGSTKATLDQIANVLGAEEPDIRVWAVEPSDMNTAMLHEALGPAEAAGANPPQRPAAAIAHLIRLRPASGRVRALDFETESAQPHFEQLPTEVRPS
ncbi:SDR family NAD(P)-dependent oxidoreductase [Natronoglycomyces albus]|uniref:SDR family NAD(P)-dependent oxidoreductase n=1 Tax=Natronoglycomyces albus TaxID=2811108 RepID=A0A895XP21_9ACTN|nr:SDR family NAD(P)-dependent oxidoreductase [Natronoglycomyces albus]QSB04040.1 SDR family NAD(P)-dependent oxidoreductase [Natronoglycomyces albus]